MGRALRHRLEPRQKIGQGLKDGRTHSVWKGEEMLPREWGRQWKCHTQKTQKYKEGFIMQLFSEKVKVLGCQGER